VYVRSREEKKKKDIREKILSASGEQTIQEVCSSTSIFEENDSNMKLDLYMVSGKLIKPTTN